MILCNDGIPLLLLRIVWLNEHLAELLQLLRTADFLSEKRELDDMEEFLIKFMGLVEILLLHGVPNTAVFAI